MTEKGRTAFFYSCASKVGTCCQSREFERGRQPDLPVMRDACGCHSAARCDARERPAARSSGVEGNASSHKVCCTPPIIWPDATPDPRPRVTYRGIQE
jgi:hypothetical protein